MPKFEQLGFGSPGVKPEFKKENPDAERRLAAAREAGLRKQGAEARASLKRALEEAGLDEEKNPDEEKKELAA
ncbi:MAG: hypothetical protein PHR36_00280 [Patescibacteria group bacterium]|nr:hypothetical protein [Patescibacteria group bacterium]